MWRFWGVFLLLLVLVGCETKVDPEAKAKPPEIAQVEVYKLAPQTWRQTIRTFGVIEAAEKVTVSAEFSGKITGVHFAEGQEIQAGQKLLDFDLSERRMLVKQADGNLVGAKIRLDEARSLAKRRGVLYAQKAISKEQLEAYNSDLASAEAQYEQLLVGRSLARHNLNRTRLSSPVAGRVVTKSIDEGEVAMPGQPLAVIHVTDTMRVVTHVTEQEINTVQVGAECLVTTPGVKGRVYTAHIESRGDVADPLTGNFPIKLTVKNEDGLLKAGMTAIVSLGGLEVNDALLIPDTAVVDRHRERVVFLVKDGRAEEVVPVLAATTGELLPVLHGVDVGDVLVVGGLDNVVHGTKLKIVRSLDGVQAISSSSSSQSNKGESGKKDGSDADESAN